MPAKRKYTDETREQAYAMSATGMAEREIARTLDVPLSTLRRWMDAMPRKTADECAQKRTDKKVEFIDNAWALVSKSILLADKRITRALEHEGELDELIDAIDDEDMPAPTKAALISKVRTLQIQSVRELSTLIGTMYDKAALAAGESTVNAGFEVKITVVD